MEEATPDLDPPDQFEWLWIWFWELSTTRRQGPNGPDPITYSDIEVWSRLTGNILLREEIAIIRQMDDAFLSSLTEEYREQREREKES
jgi:hypothetical protein